MKGLLAQFFSPAQQTLTTRPIPTEDAPSYVPLPSHRYQHNFQEDDNVTWIPDEPVHSLASSRTLTGSDCQPHTRKSARSPKPESSTQKSLRVALQREFGDKRPYQRVATRTQNSPLAIHMPKPKPVAGSFRPLDTLSQNPHARRPSTYGKSPARGVNGNSLKFTALQGDNVINPKQQHKFPSEDDEHRSAKRRRVEEPVVTGREQMSPVVKRRTQGTPLLVSYQSSQSAPSISRRASGRGDHHFSQLEFRSVEQRMLAKRNRKGSQDSNTTVGRNLNNNAANYRRPYSAEPEVATGAPRLSQMEAFEVEDPPGRGPRRLQSGKNDRQVGPIDLTDDQEEDIDDDLMIVSERSSDRKQSQDRSAPGTEHDRLFEDSTSTVEEYEDIRTQKAKPEISKYFSRSIIESVPASSANELNSDSIVVIPDDSQSQPYPDLSGVLEGLRTQKDAQQNSYFHQNYVASSQDEKPQQQEDFMAGLSDAAAIESDEHMDRDELATSVPKALPCSPFPVHLSKSEKGSAGSKTGVRPGRTVQSAQVVRANGAGSNANGARSLAAVANPQGEEVDELALPESPRKSIPVTSGANKNDIQPAKLVNVKKSSTASKANARKSAKASAASPVWSPSELHTWPHNIVDAVGNDLKLTFDSAGQALQIESGSDDFPDKFRIQCKDIYQIGAAHSPDDCKHVNIKMRQTSHEQVQFYCILFDVPTEGHNFVETLAQVTKIAPTHREPSHLQGTFERARTAERPALPVRKNDVVHDPEIDLLQQRKAVRDATISPEEPVRHLGPQVTEKMSRRSSSSPPSTNKITSHHFRDASTEEATRGNGHSPAARQNPRRTTRSAIPNNRSKSPTYDDFEVPDSLKFSKTTGLGDPWDQAVIFPSTGRNRATVDFKDLSLLDEGEWLNDSLIEFQIRYLFDKYKPRDDQVHTLSTHFYSTLTGNVGGNNINYARVQKWTQKDDLFSKDFVLVPVNEDWHWYLVLIVNLPKIERRLPEVDEREAKRADVVADASNTASTTTATAPDGLSELAVSDMPTEPQQQMPSEDTEMVDAISQQAENLQLEPTSQASSILFDPPTKAVDPEVQAESKPEPTSTATTFRKAAGGKRKPPAPAPRKYSPTQPMVVILDPLGCPRPRTIFNMKEYLVMEAEDKRGINITRQDFLGVNLRRGLPQQANFSDCGVFILGYIEQLMRDPKKFAARLFENDFEVERDWVDLRPSAMRNTMRSTLQQLAKEQDAERMRVRREKKKARKEALAKSSPMKAEAPLSPEESKRHSVLAVPATSSKTTIADTKVMDQEKEAPEFPSEDMHESAVEVTSRALQAVVEDP